MRISAPAAGIYVHIPFCFRKCRYCDFYSTTDLSLKEDFIEALCREIAATPSPFPVDTIYIGGGTPSILAPCDIGRIIKQLMAKFSIDPFAEITMEINPGTVTYDSLRAYREYGINRINIGIQSFQDNWLEWLGRLHSAELAQNAFSWARKAGFDRIGMDLIYGIPDQNHASWITDLHQGISLKPEHISCYMLTCEPGTPLDRMRCDRKFEPTSDDDICNLFETTVVELSKSGYQLYEVSNFARTDNEPDINRSRHNLKYWTDAPYLGFGPSAHSYIEPIRYGNHRDLETYKMDLKHGRLPIAEKETLSTEQRLMETIFLGLRTAEGISIPRFEKISEKSFFRMFQDILTDPEFEKWVTWNLNRCALTLQGMTIMDSIAGKFIERI